MFCMQQNIVVVTLSRFINTKLTQIEPTLHLEVNEEDNDVEIYKSMRRRNDISLFI
jgi:hypothetical protein